MPQRRVIIPEIGEVILSKRRGARNLRLSITAKGDVRVSMPAWTPYAAGISFAKSRSDWVLEHLQAYRPLQLREGMLVGKAHRLHFIDNGAKTIRTRVTAATIEVSSGRAEADPQVQSKAAVAAERALRTEADHLLPQRLRILADRHGYKYKEVRIRKLTSRWGSCSHQQVISLSYYLMQLPWPLIDYVLLHELTHTKHLHHGPAFWAAFEEALPGAKKLRKDIRGHKPRLDPS